MVFVPVQFSKVEQTTQSRQKGNGMKRINNKSPVTVTSSIDFENELII